MEIVVKQRVRPFASGWCGCHGSCLVGASSVLGAAAPEPRKPKTGKKECLQSRTTPTEMDRSRSNQNKLPCAPFACLGSDSHGILCLAGGGLLGPAGTEPGQVCCICTYIYMYMYTYSRYQNQNIDRTGNICCKNFWPATFCMPWF